MKTPLPEPIRSYYATAGADDADATIALFAADGAVRDEGVEHRGRSAIREWIALATRKYGPLRLEPTDVAESGDALVVTTVVSGDFKGSPATLRYAFVLHDQVIERLEIT